MERQVGHRRGAPVVALQPYTAFHSHSHTSCFLLPASVSESPKFPFMHGMIRYHVSLPMAVFIFSEPVLPMAIAWFINRSSPLERAYEPCSQRQVGAGTWEGTSYALLLSQTNPKLADRCRRGTDALTNRSRWCAAECQGRDRW
jgi:hypothetical protein